MIQGAALREAIVRGRVLRALRRAFSHECVGDWAVCRMQPQEGMIVRAAAYNVFSLLLPAFLVGAVACSSSKDDVGASPPADDAGVGADAETVDAIASDAASSSVDATSDAATRPKDLGTTDGTVATGWYCGKNAALKSHVATWNDPALTNDNNLFYVDKGTSTVRVVGYCTHGCVAGTTAHDECTAPSGTPVNGKECFGGAGKYCGHVLGIEARSYPAPATNVEGLFSCDATAGVSLDARCACQVVPGGADECVPPGGGRKLWIAYETATTCVSDLTDFFHCLLERTHFTDLALAYGTGS